MSARYKQCKKKHEKPKYNVGINSVGGYKGCLNKIFCRFKCILIISSFSCKWNLFSAIIIATISSEIFNPIQDGPVVPYLKTIKKYINHVTHEFC